MRIKQLTIQAIALLAIVLLGVIPAEAANKPTLNRIEPPCWWTGFTNPSLQLMVYGERISETKPEIKYEGVELVATSSVENPNYLFLDLRLSPNVKPGKFEITFKQNGKTIVASTYELKTREK
ncbi:MAG TPA: cyclomaltodextrinase N-terminal domain-containing protein, partial [Prolixibacteraceae bacterium]